MQVQYRVYIKIKWAHESHRQIQPEPVKELINKVLSCFSCPIGTLLVNHSVHHSCWGGEVNHCQLSYHQKQTIAHYGELNAWGHESKVACYFSQAMHMVNMWS